MAERGLGEIESSGGSGLAARFSDCRDKPEVSEVEMERARAYPFVGRLHEEHS